MRFDFLLFDRLKENSSKIIWSGGRRRRLPRSAGKLLGAWVFAAFRSTGSILAFDSARMVEAVPNFDAGATKFGTFILLDFYKSQKPSPAQKRGRARRFPGSE